ncbi:glucose-6-phosphate dehydrogenase [Xanthomonas euvesicatoria pv. eucalypti]|uniref:glucose-6-phosphate dehydrogenase n=1 Tax=Xanthomonas euvesicatoria TaxID=456327 RepID=UPI0026E3AE94|nr:glucose-6-phosphate dehydrogenase [Xanthomonas euvesicatoria]MDO7934256.1 glucose-6-phosphate dehydrogenase [Xanthomonas euvesicatoria pv. eucalypti]MDO7938487.1 glucose-6-phosphate dehydrogenase [Xanthomonas euvesicatoria pv. eucalypti]MDO7942627.1 glucose-6-phosphate dehydrogenase [Xanthomonas euvesicatoria pv. eucalypti]MDO7943874.1 glucose-6-phosphate dehydrogenase [Xanthomonas euvesicatoria pv. eucalypti]MDO7951067.1 glucose-6-phosphate dehydrogenase [Xanthomonas euvesicatoria pv. euca
MSEQATTPPCIIVVFGARGDLTKRLVMPALYNLRRSGALGDEFAIVGMDHGDISERAWRTNMGQSMTQLLSSRDAEFQTDQFDTATWDWLRERMHYLRGDFTDQGAYRSLGGVLDKLHKRYGTQGNVLFYLATAARFFEPVLLNLGEAGLVRQREGEGWRRVIVEKPFGHDLPSAQHLNATVAKVLHEDQVFRIDHFLGKETVQNILAFRFANGLFEPVWNRDRIDHVQITAAETIGVEGRGRFYDPTGCLRDMVPNHLFQLLAMIAMEPPAAFTTEAMHRRRAEVIEAVRPIRPEDVVRGQYASGAVNRNAVPGYREEDTVPDDSDTETYVAMKLQVDTWRWAGVPFYLRTGKRLRERTTEIAIRFKPAPLAPFRSTEVGGYGPDWLVLHIQPDEGISLQFDVKRPGAQVALAPVRMDFRYRDWFPKEYTVGYERLLQDCMNGEAGLFQDAAMVEGAWRIVQPILDAWKQPPSDFPNYAAGSAGPSAADALLAMNGGHAWRALTPGRKPPPRRPPEARAGAATPVKNATRKTASKVGKAPAKKVTRASARRASAATAKSSQDAATLSGSAAKKAVRKRATSKVAKTAAKTVSKTAAGNGAAKKSVSRTAARTPRR